MANVLLMASVAFLIGCAVSLAVADVSGVCRAAEIETRRSSESREIREWADLLQRGSDVERFRAVRALTVLGPKASAVAPELVHALDDREIGQWAAVALSKVGDTAVGPLVQGLSVQDPVAVGWAVHALSNIHPPQTGALVARLRSPDSRIRAGVARALGKIGRNAVESAPAIAEAMRDCDVDVRVAAANALWCVGRDLRALDVLERTARDAPFETRRDAVNALGQADSLAPTRLKALVNALGDEPGIAGNSFGFLEEVGAPAVPYLMEGLSASKEHARTRAARLLGDIGTDASPAIPLLIRLLDDPDPKVRQAAAFALGRVDCQAVKSIDALTALLSDKNECVRLAAAESLWRLVRHGDSPPMLMRGLTSRSSDALDMALRAIGSLGIEAKDAIPSITRLIQEDDAWDDEAVGALVAIGQPAVPAAVEMLRDRRSRVRQVGAHVIRDMGHVARPASGEMLRAICDKDHRVRIAVVEGLARIESEDPAVMANLTQTLHDPEGSVRVAAASALWQMRHCPSALDVLIAALRETSASARVDAISALRGIGLDARPAVAEIVKALDDSVPEVQYTAAKILLEIDSESAGKLGLR